MFLLSCGAQGVFQTWVDPKGERGCFGGGHYRHKFLQMYCIAQDSNLGSTRKVPEAPLHVGRNDTPRAQAYG